MDLFLFMKRMSDPQKMRNMKKEEYQPTENSRLDVCVWEDSLEASHCWKRMFVKWLTLKERLLAKDMEDVGCLPMGKGGRKDGMSKSLAEDRFNLHLVLFLFFLSLPMWYGKSILTGVQKHSKLNLVVSKGGKKQM